MADPVAITTEQSVVWDFDCTDGRGRVVKIDGTPRATLSDETVATVAVAMKEGAENVWTVTVTGMSAPPDGSMQQVMVTADADTTESVNDVSAVGQFTVTADPRTTQRVSELKGGAVVDRPV